MSTRDRTWMDDSASCAQSDPALFFAEKHDDPDLPSVLDQTRTAQAICRSGCPLRRECLTYALEGPEEGVWGGTSGPWRAKARKRIAAGVTTVEDVVDAELEQDHDTATAAA